MMTGNRITLTIDGRTVQTTAEATILDAALANGLYIPHLCSHDDLRHTGSCRLCMVKVEGQAGVAAACATQVREGMVVDTRDEMAERVRRLSVDLLFSTHPQDCTGCPKYGRCQLQSISQVVGDTGRALRRRPIGVAADASNPLVLHEMHRCILCGRCVRACGELRGVGALAMEKVDGRMRVAAKGATLAEADCRFCGACIEVCPTGAIRDQEAIARKMAERPREEALLPCKAECPAHIDIPRYVRLVREGSYAAAVAVIREKVPFPHVLGYVCNHRCETGCRRADLNQAVAIRDLKRFACEHDDGSRAQTIAQKPDTGKRIAILGSGPAGLTAAHYLARLGHRVTVFEAMEKAGGMLRYGIPAFRLPREVLDKEVEAIRAQGIQLHLGRKIEEPTGLLTQGFDAVLMATGAGMGVRLPVPGNQLHGVLLGVDFLRAVEQGAQPPLGARVTILGGGNVALDCAGVARRLGVRTPRMICLEPEGALPCDGEELSMALEEGLQVHSGSAFLEITGEAGRATGVRVAKVQSFAIDAEGKSHIELVPGSEDWLAADTVIFATGQQTGLAEACGLQLGRGGRVVAAQCATSVPGVFAAGDVVTGTDSVIRAIAGAREAAVAIDRYLGGDGDIAEAPAPEQEAVAAIGPMEGFAGMERVPPHRVPAAGRVESFAAMDLNYCEAEACCEASRCLQCDLRLNIAPQTFWTDYEAAKEVPR